MMRVTISPSGVGTMRKLERVKTNYPGVFYYNVISPATGKPERLYYIRYRKDGKEVEEPCGRQYQDDMTPARASNIRAEKIKGHKLSRKEVREEARKVTWTVDRLWHEYSDSKPDTKTWRTDRGRYKNYIEPSLGAKEPNQITMIETHRLRLKIAKHLKPQTVKHILTLLQRIVNFGVDKGLCPGLTFKPETPKVHNLKTEDLTDEQLSNLLTAIDQDYDIQAKNYIRLILVTGLRRSELFKLRWEHLDFDKGFIYIIGGKSGRNQSIPMNQSAREILENHPRTDSPFVFPGRGGGQRTDIKRPVNRIRKAAGLPPDFRPLHGLRHHFASQLASSGQVDLYTLQRLLTHQNSKTTERYAHLRDAALRRASDLAGDLIGQAMNGVGLRIVDQKK
jgi:integrase